MQIDCASVDRVHFVDHISLQSRGKNKEKIAMSILYSNEDNIPLGIWLTAIQIVAAIIKQESPPIADKPARCFRKRRPALERSI